MTQPGPDHAVSVPVREMGPWFHNLHLPDGSQTAPEHPLGDFPTCKWQQIAGHLPDSLQGWTALDIGCNAGFYSIELARRGAQVVAIDKDAHFLRQAEWAIHTFGVEDRVELRQAQVYDLLHTRERFDLVLFMGVFYHLRYPLLALDIVAEKVNRMLVFQTLTIPGDAVFPPAGDIAIQERELMLQPGWPKMAFIENSLAGDETNWWAPNHAAVESLLRSTGMHSIRRIAHEIYFCEPGKRSVPEARTWDIDEMRSATGEHDRRPGKQAIWTPSRHQPEEPPAPRFVLPETRAVDSASSPGTRPKQNE